MRSFVLAAVVAVCFSAVAKADCPGGVCGRTPPAVSAPTMAPTVGFAAAPAVRLASYCRQNHPVVHSARYRVTHPFGGRCRRR